MHFPVNSFLYEKGHAWVPLPSRSLHSTHTHANCKEPNDSLMQEGFCSLNSCSATPVIASHSGSFKAGTCHVRRPPHFVGRFKVMAVGINSTRSSCHRQRTKKK
jgi:hypothetical protein